MGSDQSSEQSSQYLKENIAGLKKIKHIVVLMLENRSFDNLLGWLYDGETVPNGQEYEGLSDGLWNGLAQVDSDGNPFIEKVPINRNGTVRDKNGKITQKENFCLPDPDPGEGFADTTYQLFQQYKVGESYPPAPINMGFVQNYQDAQTFSYIHYKEGPTNPREIMTCYTPLQTPVLSALAKTFAVCDQYHACVPSQTLPNRSFVHAATSDGHVNNSPNATTTSNTIFNLIEDQINNGKTELSWKIYGDNLMSDTHSAKSAAEDAAGKFGKNHFSLTRLTMETLWPSTFDKNFGSIHEFYKACEDNKLPSYSFLEPRFGTKWQNDQHPPTDIRAGEKLIADIYNAVLTSPAFNETLLVITYDEHGGCYDHYPPQGGAASPDPTAPTGQQGFLFKRFGIRVPCVLVNPYIPQGTIARPNGWTPYDHTSIIKTVQNCFGIDGKLSERSEAAPDLSGVLQLETPRTGFEKIQAPEFEPKDYGVNSLHRLMAKIIVDISGEETPEDDEAMLEFIHSTYHKLFTDRTIDIQSPKQINTK